MKKLITIKRIVLFSTILLFAITGITVFCAIPKTTGNNSTFAQLELDLLMFQIENKIIDLDTLNDQEYINIGHRFAALINTIGNVKFQKEHYFRIHFSRAPKTLDEMIEIILNQENNIFDWKLLPWQSMAFHMYGIDGEYNLKFISADGHFEAVYNKSGILLTQENDPKNMGTFNYAHQLADQVTHYNLDIWPYFMWDNTEETMDFLKNDDELRNTVPIDKNEDAMKRYNEYKEMLSKS
ncbi:MAG: hypothetical protein Ta2A_09460 [Treponemataceae bacterium]|nr:MAG: hypothetical protein Ta2A_09460 [Treponemataceae bacterium]